MKNIKLIRKLLNEYLELLKKDRQSHFRLACKYNDGVTAEPTEEYKEFALIYAQNRIYNNNIKIKELIELLKQG